MKIKPYSSNRILITSENGLCISVSDSGNTIDIQKHISENHQESSITLDGEFYNYTEHFANDQKTEIKNADVIRLR